MRKRLLLMLGVLFIGIQLSAQNRTITGKVTDDKGAGIANASVIIKGTASGTNTAADGSFSLSAPQTAKALIVSFVGMDEKEISLTTASNYTVSLSTKATNDLQEVVVTGYTITQRKKFSGATTTVATNEVRKQPFASFDQALQGQASGVSVVANSGQPGANAVVRIRGNGSINGGNVPLYIMDGIEINAADFATLNQGDFERVEVLKDAVATAMYGSRGANGVIVITTRKGRSGQLQFNYDAQVGFSKLPEDRLVVMNSSQKIDYELQRGNPYGWTAAQQDSLRKVNFSWRDALFQTGITQQHMISASGGNQNSRVFASLSYMNQDGILKTTGLQRYTARLNSDNNIKNWRFGLNVQGGYSKVVGTSEANTFLSSPLNAIRWGNPYERDINPNTADWQQFGGAGLLTSGQPNAAMELFLNYNWAIQVKGIGTTYLEFHFPFVRGLYARTNWGVDYTQNETAGFTSPKTSTGQSRQGSLSRALGRNLRYTGTTSVNYKRDFNKHEIDAGLYTEVVKNNSRSFGFTGYGFTNGFTNEAGITAGSSTNNYIPSVTGNGSENGILSYFTIINYGYNNKYYLALVGRRDGSSKFGINNRFANFGSVGASWVVTGEDFMRNVNFVNELKLRASIGTNGNNLTQLGDFPIPQFGRISYAGVSGWSLSTLGNLDYRWETNRTINIGVDFAVLQRRLSGTIDLYNRKTLDLFYALPITPVGTGFINISSNFGSLRNRGIELSLNGDIFRSKDFRWSLGGNITYNENRVLSLPQDSVISGTTILAKGKPINSFYLVEYTGVDPANGNAMYKKRDKSTTAVYNANDKVIWGTSDAPWFGAINTSLDFKGFDFSAQVNFFLKRQMYNNDRNNVTNPSYLLDNMSIDVLREWKKAGDITDVPRPSAGTSGGTAPANPYQTSTTRFLEDASFWRLRNITLGYTVSQNLLSKAKIRTARIFIQAQNWWTRTDFKSFDPEATGVSLTGAQYPALVQTTVGLSIGF